VITDGQGTTDPAVGTHTYDAGTQVELTAEPAEGWTFKKWVVNGTVFTE